MSTLVDLEPHSHWVFDFDERELTAVLAYLEEYPIGGFGERVGGFGAEELDNAIQILRVVQRMREAIA